MRLLHSPNSHRGCLVAYLSLRQCLTTAQQCITKALLCSPRAAPGVDLRVGCSLVGWAAFRKEDPEVAVRVCSWFAGPCASMCWAGWAASHGPVDQLPAAALPCQCLSLMWFPELNVHPVTFRVACLWLSAATRSWQWCMPCLPATSSLLVGQVPQLLRASLWRICCSLLVW